METAMANYYEQTVVQPTIPDADMTPLEQLLLSRIFQFEMEGDGWYFFAEEHPTEVVGAIRDELERALASLPDTDSTLHRCVAEQLADADSDATEVRLDFTGTSWEPFFQDIVKRSKTLRYVTVISAFTCSKMRPDGFGGMAILITRDAILGKSTSDILDDFLVEAGLAGDEVLDAKASDAAPAEAP
jgi:hypothetical protein